MLILLSLGWKLSPSSSCANPSFCFFMICLRNGCMHTKGSHETEFVPCRNNTAPYVSLRLFVSCKCETSCCHCASVSAGLYKATPHPPCKPPLIHKQHTDQKITVAVAFSLSGLRSFHTSYGVLFVDPIACSPILITIIIITPSLSHHHYHHNTTIISTGISTSLSLLRVS